MKKGIFLMLLVVSISLFSNLAIYANNNDLVGNWLVYETKNPQFKWFETFYAQGYLFVSKAKEGRAFKWEYNNGKLSVECGKLDKRGRIKIIDENKFIWYGSYKRCSSTEDKECEYIKFSYTFERISSK